MGRPPHLLRVSVPAGRFSDLIGAAREAGHRVGWLELQPAEPRPPGLEEAATQGVLRAVGVGGGRSVSVKPLRGPSVLDDLLREHFRGCSLVLVRGTVEAPLLTPMEEGRWQVADGGEPASHTTEELVRELRRPHPWRRAAPAAEGSSGGLAT